MTVPDPTPEDDVIGLAQVLEGAGVHPGSWDAAEYILSSDWLARRDARVRAEAVRAFGDTLGVNVGDEDDEWWRGYRQGQREALHAAQKAARRIERGESL